MQVLLFDRPHLAGTPPFRGRDFLLQFYDAGLARHVGGDEEAHRKAS
jgi:hypothetical protein